VLCVRYPMSSLALSNSFIVIGGAIAAAILMSLALERVAFRPVRGGAATGRANGMIDPEMLGLLWQTPVGNVQVYRVANTVLTIVGVFMSLVGQRIALVGGLIALFSFVQIGHVPELKLRSVRLLLLLHILGIAFWIGVLGLLSALSQRPEYRSNAAVLEHRFGQAASVIVPALIAAELLIAWMLLGHLCALTTTGYGQTLLIKLALVGAVLTLAVANKLRFVPAMQAGTRKLRATWHAPLKSNLRSFW